MSTHSLNLKQFRSLLMSMYSFFLPSLSRIFSMWNKFSVVKPFACDKETDRYFIQTIYLLFILLSLKYSFFLDMNMWSVVDLDVLTVKNSTLTSTGINFWNLLFIVVIAYIWWYWFEISLHCQGLSRFMYFYIFLDVTGWHWSIRTFTMTWMMFLRGNPLLLISKAQKQV